MQAIWEKTKALAELEQNEGLVKSSELFEKLFKENYFEMSSVEARIIQPTLSRHKIDKKKRRVVPRRKGSDQGGSKETGESEALTALSLFDRQKAQSVLSTSLTNLREDQVHEVWAILNNQKLTLVHSPLSQRVEINLETLSDEIIKELLVYTNRSKFKGLIAQPRKILERKNRPVKLKPLELEDSSNSSLSFR